MIKCDNVLISGDALTYSSERGRGLIVDYDSDDNKVTNSDAISTDAASTGQVRQLPGGPFKHDDHDNKIHLLHANKPLQNFVVSGILIQVAADEPRSDIEDSGRFKPQSH